MSRKIRTATLSMSTSTSKRAASPITTRATRWSTTTREPTPTASSGSRSTPTTIRCGIPSMPSSPAEAAFGARTSRRRLPAAKSGQRRRRSPLPRRPGRLQATPARWTRLRRPLRVPPRPLPRPRRRRPSRRPATAGSGRAMRTLTSGATAIGRTSRRTSTSRTAAPSPRRPTPTVASFRPWATSGATSSWRRTTMATRLPTTGALLAAGGGAGGGRAGLGSGVAAAASRGAAGRL